MGTHPNFFLALAESPNKFSTSVGLKYFESTFITISPLSFLFPISFSPLPSQVIPPHPIDWDARDDFHYLGGFVLGIAAKMGVNIRWGGDWSDSSLSQGRRTTKDNSFDDLVHFELKE